MSEDVAVTASTFLNGTPPSHFRDFKKEWAAATAAAAASSASTASTGPGKMSSQNGGSGGQMMTFSPPAGDGAGTTGSTAPEATSSVSDLSGDAEGVWSVDIDQAFQEALAIYPPCGRRKIIISDEGKMYGRNELIARYIKLRCGKTRTRKQVSSHIQVLARKKMRDEQARKKSEPCLPSTAISLSSSVISQPLSVMSTSPTSSPPTPPKSVSAAQVSIPIVEQSAEELSQELFLRSLQNPQIWSFPQGTGLATQLPFGVDLSQLVPSKTDLVVETAVTHPITSSSLSLLGFSAYVQCNQTKKRTELVTIDSNLENEPIRISMFYDRYPDVLRDLYEKSERKDIFFLAKCWANINVPEDVMNFQYAVDSCYSSQEKFHLKVSTMACSFGKQAVEKIEAYPPTEIGDGSYQFVLNNSPMCDYMVKFISELKKLENVELMDSVLANFTVLQVVTNNETNEPIMVVCFVFEVSQESEPSCRVFRLVD